MLAQDWRVKTVRMKGSVSPCCCTMEAIWITGSLSASGKIPGKQQVITGDCHGIKSGHTDQILFMLSTAVSRKPHRKGHTFPSSTLNIKAKDSEGCNPLPLSLCWVAYEISPSNIHLILTQGHLKGKKKSLAVTFKSMEILKKEEHNYATATRGKFAYLAQVLRISGRCVFLFSHSILSFRKFNPAAPHHISVHHKPENAARLFKLQTFECVTSTTMCDCINGCWSVSLNVQRNL